ncbi:DUF732 domain-containing protein [Mycobacterium parmense]|uniref:Uncharacterized protein n=1 Tax=Mycobacterium parmense TaxID=185642 RepID=A0A7I7YUH2_9MYCO|nr:DUF732 domain-containing protein [Mycobacterium parmense]MCV7351600.1 DUF732 domain-containing protein [Mycobacterium parmense]ORW62487.1 hypothetical protein AWC20_05315 [Mycobacterium parmense]BBZ44937.1 hypothetical protein MPRM_22180 [Mycobacterium parmense]
MSATGRCGRVVGFGLMSGPLLGAAIVWAGPAQADPGSYLNDLHKAGIHDVNGGDAALLRTGQKLCQQISYGASPQELQGLALQRSDSTLGPNGLTPVQAAEVVNFAVADLCPQY